MTTSPKRSAARLVRIARLCCIALACAAACRGERPTDHFNTYIQSDPARLDPFYSTDVVSGRVMAHLFNGLFKISSNGSLERDLAATHRFDGTRLEATLHDGVRFHDGTALTAADVAYSLDRVRLSENPTSPRRWLFANIARIATPDERRIVITLREPSASFPHLLATPTAYIISAAAHRRDGSVVGTGPFALREWRQDERLVLARNERYFEGPARVSGIVYRIIPEDLTARFEFLNGTLDYFEVPYLARVRHDAQARTIDVPEYSVHYIAINNARPPLDNPALRAALNRAVDRRRIMRALFDNRFTLAAGPVPNTLAGHRSAARPYDYDPVAARAAIASLGLSGHRITLFIKSDHQVSLIAQMVQRDLAAAGLAVSIREMEWSALKAATLNGAYDLCYFTWHADYPDAENFLYPLFYSKNIGQGGNRAFYQNVSVDRLLDEARRTMDAGKRIDIHRRAEQLIVSDAPWIFLWYGDKRVMLGRRVRSFVPYPLYNGMKGHEIELEPDGRTTR